MKCKYAHLFLKPRRFSAGQARWIVSDVCEGGCGLKVPQQTWVNLSSAGWRNTDASPEGLCLQKWWCKSCAPDAGFDY